MNKIIRILAIQLPLVLSLHCAERRNGFVPLGVQVRIAHKAFMDSLPALDPETKKIVDLLGHELLVKNNTKVADKWYDTDGLVAKLMDQSCTSVDRVVQFLCRSGCIEQDILLKWVSNLHNEKFAYLIVDECLNSGRDVNAKILGDSTLLHKFSYYRKPRVVRMLLQRGARVNELSRNGETPLQTACYQTGNLECVELLLEHGANPNTGLNSLFHASPLVRAATQGIPELCETLVKHGALLSLKDRKNRSQLQIAATEFCNAEYKRVLRDRIVGELKETVLKEACSEKDRLCPICFASYQELCGSGEAISLERVDLFGCCVQPICRDCKATFEAQHLSCPICRNPNISI